MLPHNFQNEPRRKARRERRGGVGDALPTTSTAQLSWVALPTINSFLLQSRSSSPLGRDEARPDARESRPYDVVISYARRQSKEADQFVRAL
jgi:hypothetical protein